MRNFSTLTSGVFVILSGLMLISPLHGMMENTTQGEEDTKTSVPPKKEDGDPKNANGLCQLAYNYRRGYGVKQDYEKAVALFQQAADLGYPSAINNLAEMYEAGDGVEKDGKKAISLYLTTAKKGNSTALYALGEMYEHGKGVEIDLPQAYEFYRLAVIQGCNGARSQLCSLADTIRWLKGSGSVLGYNYNRELKREENYHRFEKSFSFSEWRRYFGEPDTQAEKLRDLDKLRQEINNKPQLKKDLLEGLLDPQHGDL